MISPFSHHVSARRSKTILVSVGAVVVAALLLAGRPSIAQAPDFDTQMNAARPDTPCTQGNGAGKPCMGHPPANWYNYTDPIEAENLATWIKTLQFDKEKVPVDREPKQRISIAQIADIQSVWMPDLGRSPLRERALVVARLTAHEPTLGNLDARYKIGRRKNWRLENQFYIVVEDYTPDKKTYGPEKSFKIGTWHVYGIDTTFSGGQPVLRLRRIPGAQGNFRFCGDHHDSSVSDEGAQFLTCAGATALSAAFAATPRLAQIVGDSTLASVVFAGTTTAITASTPQKRRLMLADSALARFLDARDLTMPARIRARLVRVLANPFRDPAWDPCGLGCCTADT